MNGEIGELSGCHESNGYYPGGISLETAILPEGWQDRVHGWGVASSYPANIDLAVSKLAAFREKDREFVAALIETGHVRLGVGNVDA